MEPLIIAIDFDDTFSADPELWTAFILNAQQRGHKIICVSAFPPHNKWCIEYRTSKLPVGVTVYGSWGHKKRKFMKSHNINVDIWIDDTPDMIVGDETWTPTIEEVSREFNLKKDTE